jgi:hypothetical protein
MGAHLIDGLFQSDKYPTCPRGKVPLSVKDPAAQPLLWAYAESHRTKDAEFSDDLQAALRAAGYVPDVAVCAACMPHWVGFVTPSTAPIPTCVRCKQPCSKGHWILPDR